MNRRTLLTLVSALLLLLGASTVRAAEVLRVITDATFPPMAFIKDGKRAGFEVDLIEALAAAMGRQIEWMDSDFKGLIPALRAERADVAIAAIHITPERRKVIDFVGPYYSGGLVVLVRQSGPIQTLKDLNHRTVAVQQGTLAAEYLKARFPLVRRAEMETNTDVFRSLQAGEVEAAVTAKVAAQLLVQGKTDLAILTEPIIENDYGIAVAKNKPALTLALDAALQELESNGRYQEMVKKWLSASFQGR